MSPQPRIYLDNAATSWPKPEEVYAAVDRYQRQCGAAAGRSVYAEAMEASQAVEHARQQVARLIGADDHRRIVFTANGTDALNLAIQGILRAGDHVITSVVEHNSVLRPLRRLEDSGTIEVTRVGINQFGIADPDQIKDSVKPNTRLVVLSHASNVTGALQPVKEVAALAQERGLVFLVDAAQSLGHVPLDVGQTPISLIAAPGHKGLLGPLGTGMLYIARGIEDALNCLRQGGTGTRSEDDRQPRELPEKYESGNLNVPGIVGLGAGVGYLQNIGLKSVRDHEMRLTERLLAGLADLPGVAVFGLADVSQRVGVVSLAIDGYDPQEVATMLELGHRVQVRSGLHCAPLIHQALGTLASGGTVRFSLGCFNTEQEIDTAIVAVRAIVASALPV